LFDLDVERQGNLLRNSRTATVGIPLLHFDDRSVLSGRAADRDSVGTACGTNVPEATVVFAYSTY
jgi:hypothetical protein